VRAASKAADISYNLGSRIPGLEGAGPDARREESGSMPSLVGQTVSHYRIVRQIGSGGMGVVYEAEDSELGRRVAVKFLSAELRQDPATIERFRREARAASALSHPGICTVHAIEQHEGQSFIVMELLEGEPLAAQLERRAMDLPGLLDVAIQIADALELAHAGGIVHRDLKPVNLFVTTRGAVKILDFGLAKIGARPLSLDASRSVAEAETVVDAGQLTVSGTVMGTVHYMSPEQARGEAIDARTDLFALGAVLYEMATGRRAFSGDTQPMVFEAILNRQPRPIVEVNSAMPAELGRIVERALEKDRWLRYQSAADLKADLVRLKRQLDSAAARAAGSEEARAKEAKGVRKSIAVLYFENLSRDKEDDYLRDGITEDLLTDLSKIQGLDVFPRTTVLAYRDRHAPVTTICREIAAEYVLEGSLRRAGSRLRVNVQLVAGATGFPVWSERYDREMEDIFDVQDEIAHRIAEALRITLTPRERAELAAKPTANPQAYDLYLRGRSFARRAARQDLEFALELFEKAIAIDAGFALAHAATADVYARYHRVYLRDSASLDRARAAAERAMQLQPGLPEAVVAQGWIDYAAAHYDTAIAAARSVAARAPECEGAYYLLLRALVGAGRLQEVVDLAEEALAASGNDYNVYVPITNALGMLGRTDEQRALRSQRLRALEAHLSQAPEDARARSLLATDYAEEGRIDDAVRELHLATALRSNDAMILYNVACAYCAMSMKHEAIEVLRRAWQAGLRDADWARRDPDLAILHGDEEFERLYPERKRSE
jgi:non-specific serine/threonine protein kinase